MTGLMVCCVLASFLAKEDGITAAEVSEYRAGAIAMAHRKSAELGCSPPGARMKVGPRIATGGGFDGHFLWDVAFSVFWAVRVPEEKFPVASSLDNLYRFAEPDGYIGRQFLADGTPVWSPDHPISFNPPMLAWAELELASSALAESNRLERVYPLLLRHHQSCERKFRRPDGLYFGSALGCGMDDCPRWPHGYTLEQRAAGGIPLVATSINAPARDRWESWVRGTVATNNSWNCQAGWIDMSAAMALDARSLAKMARLVGKEDDARRLDGEYAALKEAINRLCWSEDLGFYCDVTKDGIIRRHHLGALWSLVSGVATPERAKRMVRTLFDPDVFYRPVPLASLEKGDPDYRPDDTYFRGPAWPNLNYLAIRGLLDYGYRSEAKRLARRWYACCFGLYRRTGGIYENLSSECPDRPKEILSAPDYAGHGCLTPIAVPALFEREAVSWAGVLAQPAPNPTNPTGTHPAKRP